MSKEWEFLGRIAKGDQRLAQRGKHFYLYDNSGATPDHTDDGPLRIAVDLPVVVSREYCSVRVWAEMTTTPYRVGVTHRGALRLRQLVPGLRLELNLSELGDIRDLLDAMRRDLEESSSRFQLDAEAAELNTGR